MKLKSSAITRILALVAIVALSALLVYFRDKIASLSSLGYPGIFLLNVLTNASLLLPAPTLIINTSLGAVFNPFWVAVAAGTGATIGELTGYMAGYTGTVVVENRDHYQKIKYWMDKYGAWAILVLAFIPNPLFDIAGMAAGILKMPLYKFLLACAVGKILKMYVFAFGGATILRQFI